MRVAHSERPDEGRSAPRSIPRRRFLHAGAACCVPLIAGVGLTRARSASPATPASQDGEADPVLDHMYRELATTAREMTRGLGPKGEHVRILASNLELMAAYLVSRGRDRLARATAKDGLERFGRDAFVRELSDASLRSVDEQARLVGIPRRVREDLGATGLAVDQIATKDASRLAQAAVSQLRSLARHMDRKRSAEDVTVRLAALSPDDELGDENLWKTNPELACLKLRRMIYYWSAVAVVAGMFGAPIFSGVCALWALACQISFDTNCSGMELEEG